MSIFELYFTLGWQHISDINAYDHILFIVALCACFQLKDWKQVAGLVTAFTIGHSITLALSTLNYVLIPSDLIEFLIPITIFITAIANLIGDWMAHRRMQNHDHVTVGAPLKRQYGFALFFGLIHGLGFSNYLKSLLGAENSIVQPLLAFNLGLEVGQLLIVLILLIVSYVLISVFKLPFRVWLWGISLITAVLSVYLML